MASGKVVAIKAEVLNDLASRFLINLSKEERNPIKLCTYIELAHWYYLDLMRPEDRSLPACNIKEFMRALFQHCPWLSTTQDLDELITEWKKNKFKKPLRGAILLNQDLTKCLLVQGFTSGASWGFPKGKMEEGEADVDAAVREVFEEIGYDIRAHIKEKDHLDAHLRDTHVRMYIITGVPETTPFEPRTRNEIKNIQWFHIKDLPSYKGGQVQGVSSNGFFMVIPFIMKLRGWIKGVKVKRKVISANLGGARDPSPVKRAQTSPQPKRVHVQPSGESPQPKRSQSHSHSTNQPILFQMQPSGESPQPMRAQSHSHFTNQPILLPPGESPQPMRAQSHSHFTNQPILLPSGESPQPMRAQSHSHSTNQPILFQMQPSGESPQPMRAQSHSHSTNQPVLFQMQPSGELPQPMRAQSHSHSTNQPILLQAAGSTPHATVAASVQRSQTTPLLPTPSSAPAVANPTPLLPPQPYRTPMPASLWHHSGHTPPPSRPHLLPTPPATYPAHLTTNNTRYSSNSNSPQMMLPPPTSPYLSPNQTSARSLLPATLYNRAPAMPTTPRQQYRAPGTPTAPQQQYSRAPGTPTAGATGARSQVGPSQQRPPAIPMATGTTPLPRVASAQSWLGFRFNREAILSAYHNPLSPIN